MRKLEKKYARTFIVILILSNVVSLLLYKSIIPSTCVCNCITGVGEMVEFLYENGSAIQANCICMEGTYTKEPFFIIGLVGFSLSIFLIIIFLTGRVEYAFISLILVSFTIHQLGEYVNRRAFIEAMKFETEESVENGGEYPGYPIHFYCYSRAPPIIKKINNIYYSHFYVFVKYAFLLPLTTTIYILFRFREYYL